MQRIPLLILAFIITIVTAEIPAFPEETASPDDKSANSEDRQLNLIRPAAGPIPDTYPYTSPYTDPYTNPDQERLNENKKDWWGGEGWVPPEENNPYHKW